MKKLKTELSRMALSLVTVFYSIESESLSTPENFKIFIGGNFPENIKTSLISCYQEIFSEAPWYEDWGREDVEEKLRKDLSDENSFLVVYLKEEEVAGFSWGTILEREGVKKRAALAMGTDEQNLSVKRFKDSLVLYCDEFAISKKEREGIDPVRFILRKFLTYGYSKGVTGTIFWSTPHSKIVPLAYTMGYEESGRGIVKDKEIIFLFNRDFRSLLKITKHISADCVNKIIALQKKK